MGAEGTVSVVIPAHNAAATLGETLNSVRGQSYSDLDIIVVNDRSIDATLDVARAHAAEDPRVRVLTVDNGNAAASRNAGIAASCGAFIAPVDADDLWHPNKIVRQMAVMRRDANTGYVYTFYRRVDPRGDVLPTGGAGTRIEGEAYLRSMLFNFVGNGSSLLLRREALEEVDGYEPRLSNSEDLLLQILVARTWRIGCVPEYLTGYRILPTSKSAGQEKVLRALSKVFEFVEQRFPETPRDVLAMAEAVALARLSTRRPRDGVRVLGAALRRSPSVTLAVTSEWTRQMLRRRLGLRTPSAPSGDLPPSSFWDLDPVRDVPPHHPQPLARHLHSLAAREKAFFATRPGYAHRKGRGRVGGSAMAGGRRQAAVADRT